MRFALLDLLRCPYCGGRLSLVESLFHRVRTPEVLLHGILGCHCCIFPVVDGIPVLHLQASATVARDQVQAASPELARRTLFGIEDPNRATLIDAVLDSTTATYRETIEVAGLDVEGSYLFHRFSDPTFVVAEAVTRAVARQTLASGRGVIDVCGGSGHLTRALGDCSSRPVVLTDVHFAKLWLAGRFVAPDSDLVCCDANGPLPFARGAFGLASCTDALMYIWTKRQFVGELQRLVDGNDEAGTVLICHAHNERVWSASHGQALPPQGYADLFEGTRPRLFGERAFLSDIVSGRLLDLSRRESAAALEDEPALTILATRRDDVFTGHVPHPPAPSGELRLNPLYGREPAGDRVKLVLRFPSEEYAREYGACRQYLPDVIVVPREVLEDMPSGGLSDEIAELVRRRVLLDLPPRYC